MNEKLKKVAINLYHFLLLLVISSVTEGIVLSYLWDWFVVPLGLQPVPFFHAIGLCVLLDFITYNYYDCKKSEDIGLSISIIFVLMRPVVAILVGAIVYYMM